MRRPRTASQSIARNGGPGGRVSGDRRKHKHPASRGDEEGEPGRCTVRLGVNALPCRSGARRGRGAHSRAGPRGHAWHGPSAQAIVGQYSGCLLALKSGATPACAERHLAPRPDSARRSPLPQTAVPLFFGSSASGWPDGCVLRIRSSPTRAPQLHLRSAAWSAHVLSSCRPMAAPANGLGKSWSTARRSRERLADADTAGSMVAPRVDYGCLDAAAS